jgi:hypothetical protein
MIFSWVSGLAVKGRIVYKSGKKQKTEHHGNMDFLFSKE